MLLILFFITIQSAAQPGIIHGRVINASDQSPLPFVYLRFDNSRSGTTTDIDGNFMVPDTIRQIRFSYIGFRSTDLPVARLAPEQTWNVTLYPDVRMLAAVDIYPSRDPAYRIMQAVLDHATENNPENLASYQYTSYHKFWLSADVPADDNKSGRKPISARELELLQQRFEASHMLLMETVSRRRHLYPNHDNEEILSSRVSGLQKENFTVLATQLQSFSVYKENFSLFGINYLSPISRSALKNYAFVLQDTLSREPGDTVFLVRFQPAKDRNFDGLKGFLHISSEGYAVRNLIAEPANTAKKEIYASVWQRYERLSSGHWFPAELNVAVNFPMTTTIPRDSASGKRKPLDLSVTVNSRSYLYDRVANPGLDPRDFPKYGVTLSGFQADSLAHWKELRHIGLTAKDSVTYQYLDSLGNKIRLKRKVRQIHALSLGTVPLGVVSINFMYLFGYNINEGYKVGLGLETNRRLSRYFAAGSYFTYGTRDRQFRHGEWLRIFPAGYPDFKFELSYRDVKKEFGVEELLTDYNIFEPEYYRSLLITNMYLTRNFTAGVEVRPWQPLNLKLFADKSRNRKNYYGNFVDTAWDPFQLTRAGLEIRYSPGIAFMNDPEELIQSSPPKSDIFLSVIQGMKLFKSDFQFTKIDAKAKFNIRLSALGTTTLMFRGGQIFGTSPITEWFHGYGSYSGSFTLLPHFAFATMRLNEFSADRYAILHVRHNFGKGFIPSWYFIRPELVLAENIGVGTLGENYIASTGAKDFRKGFYESGIELNKILNTNSAGLGFGTYYRYGPYRMADKNNNFAYKVTLSFRF